MVDAVSCGPSSDYSSADQIYRTDNVYRGMSAAVAINHLIALVTLEQRLVSLQLLKRCCCSSITKPPINQATSNQHKLLLQ